MMKLRHATAFALVIALTLIGTIQTGRSQTAIAAALTVAEIAAQKLAQRIQEIQAERSAARRLEMLQEQLAAQRAVVIQSHNAITGEIDQATQEQAVLKAGRDPDMSKWDDASKQRYALCEEVIKNGNDALASLKPVEQQVTDLNSMMGRLSNNPGDLTQLGAAMGRSFNSLADSLRQVLTNSKRLSVFSPSPTDPLTMEVSGGSDVVAFVIGDAAAPAPEALEIAPGMTRTVPYRKNLSIRAVALTPRRALIRQRRATPTRGATVDGSSNDFTLKYSTDSGGGVVNNVTWTSEQEEYTWTGPTPSLIRTAFDIGKTALLTTFRTNDTFHWTLPVISASRFGRDGGPQPFLLQVRGNITWRVTRSGSSANSTQSEIESFHGQLSIKIMAQ